MKPEDRLPESEIRAALERQRRRIASHVDARAGLDHAKETHTMRRALAPALATAAVLVAIVGGVALLDPFGDDPPAAGPGTTVTTPAPPPGESTTTTTTTGTSTTAASTSTSTTTVPGTTSAPSTPPAAAGAVFTVTRVASNDVLNVRAEPSADAAIVGTLPPGAEVPTTGLAVPDLPAAGWWEVELEGGERGWVNRRFVGFGPGAAVDSLDCASLDENPIDLGGQPSAADHVLGLDFTAGGQCDRFVILLGTGGGGMAEPPWRADPATAPPSGISVSPEGSVVTVTLPAQVASVRPTATEADFGTVKAFVVREFPEGSTPGPLLVRLHYSQNVSVGAWLLNDPARVVVDTRPAPTGTGLDYTPVVGPLVALERPVNVDVAGPGVGLPITVAGYARPFEAQGAVTLEAATGSLSPDTTIDGVPASDGVGSFLTTDWVDTWGRFEFTIDGLDPGRHRMFVGDFSAEDGTPTGLTHEFTVAGS